MFCVVAQMRCIVDMSTCIHTDTCICIRTYVATRVCEEAIMYSVLQCVAACCSVVQCVAECCSVL